MTAAVNAVNNEGSSLRAASRLYNVPIESLRRRVIGQVDVECRPSPQTVLSKEEDHLAKYCIEMADRGFGLAREDVTRFAFQIAEKMNKSHPFQNGMAGRGWYERFLSRHPYLHLRSSQPLTRCRAMCSNKAVIADFFSKLELACANDIHLLCLPAHTTHILQPLDIGVFKVFKSHFHVACRQHTGESLEELSR